MLQLQPFEAGAWIAREMRCNHRLRTKTGSFGASKAECGAQTVGARAGGKPQLSTRHCRGKTRGNATCESTIGSTTTAQLPTTAPRTSTWLHSQLLTWVLSTNRCDSLGQPQVANNTTSKTADAKPVAHTPLLFFGRLLTMPIPLD